MAENENLKHIINKEGLKKIAGDLRNTIVMMI